MTLIFIDYTIQNARITITNDSSPNILLIDVESY